MPITIADPVIDVSGDGRISAEDKMLDRADVIINAKFVRIEGVSISVRTGGENHTLVTERNRQELYEEFGVPGDRNILFNQAMMRKIHTFKEWFTGRLFNPPIGQETTDAQLEDVESEFNSEYLFNRTVGDTYSYRRGHRFLHNHPQTKHFIIGKTYTENHIDPEYTAGKSSDNYMQEKTELELQQQGLEQTSEKATTQEQKNAINKEINRIKERVWLIDEITKRKFSGGETQSGDGEEASNANEVKTFGDKLNYHEGNVTAYRQGNKSLTVNGTVKKEVTGTIDSTVIGNKKVEVSNTKVSVINGDYVGTTNGTTYTKIGKTFASEKGGMFRELVYGHNLNYRWGDQILRNHGDKNDFNLGRKSSDTFGEGTSVAFGNKEETFFGESFTYTTHSQSVTNKSQSYLQALSMDMAEASLGATQLALSASAFATALFADSLFSTSYTALSTSGPSFHFGRLDFDKKAPPKDRYGTKTENLRPDQVVTL